MNLSLELGLESSPKIFEEIFLRNLCYEVLIGYLHSSRIYGIHFVDFDEIPTLQDGWHLFLEDGTRGNPHPNGGIQIKFTTKENYNIKWIAMKKEFLIVETYRLDQNALPGNELWMGKVSKDKSEPSFDIRNTATPFIHNPHINETRVNGNNLHIYSSVTISHWKENWSINTEQ